MQAINASTGRFFTRFSGMIASGVQGRFQSLFDYFRATMRPLRSGNGGNLSDAT